MTDKNINYTEAFAELQQILVEIEEGAISLDELSDQVNRASLLIQVCKAKLSNTEENVSKILEQLSPKQDGSTDI